MLLQIIAGYWKVLEDVRARMFPYTGGLYLKELEGFKESGKKVCIETFGWDYIL